MEYTDFLKEKEITDIETGHEPKSINPKLFNFQADIDRWAIRRGRAAIFADCGLGKTPMQLEWARQVNEHTNKPILIVAPLAVSVQTKREGNKFDIPVNICKDQSDIKNGINITNYEKLDHFDAYNFSGIVLDESSILKSYTGKTRNKIIEMFSRTPYKLACTATPSPNDFMELGNHAEFLGVLTRSEMLSMFFINDTANVGTWRLKGHGEDEFWKWVCSWAVMIKKPSDLGYDDDGFILPELSIIENKIEYGKPLPGNLFVKNATTLSDRRLARKETITQRCEQAAELATNSNQWLLWCGLNDESKMLKELIPDAVEVTGSDSDEHKESAIMDFAEGNIRALITKPKIAGFGVNWQSCSNMAFVGLSDSYESYYQCIRRCWRFGQDKPVNVHVITADIEGNVVDNIKRKEKDAEKMSEKMVGIMADYSKEEIKSTKQMEYDYKNEVYHGENCTLYLGDCVDVAGKLDDNSIGYSIFSPPFASLFTYTNSVRDMGNCSNMDSFLKHFIYLVDELYRVIMDGRLVSIHCMNLPATISHDGFIGMKDFRGEIIRMFEKAGFIYHSEVCIWKDPLVQAVRTKVLTLAHKQVVKDSSRSAQGLPDYIVTMRKPGVNQKPIERPDGFKYYVGGDELSKHLKHDTDQRKNKLSHQIWQRYASPVWFDIRQTRVLNKDMARDEKDEKHVCPLQLDTIERCLELWSAEDDTVFSPFAGIGSEIYSAVRMGRKAIGVELKESYFRQAIKNIENIKYRDSQLDLFADIEKKEADNVA